MGKFGEPTLRHNILGPNHRDSSPNVVTKGSLVVGSSAPKWDKLTVGSNSQVLTADSAQASGVKWAAPAAGGATIALDNLASVQINASLLFDADSTYDIGDSTNFVANAYIDRLYLNSTAFLDGIVAGEAQWSAHLKPKAGSTYDLGDSTLTWRDLHLSRDIWMNSAGAFYPGNDADIFISGGGGDLNIYDFGAGNIYIGGSNPIIIDDSDLIPFTDLSYDLGALDKFWANAYINKLFLDADSTIEAADVDNFQTAYDHSQDNTQAHTDYLLNNAADTTSGRLTMAGFALGANYGDIAEIAVPANPSAGTRRLFIDSATNEISVRTSAGATVSLEGAGGAGANTALSNLASVAINLSLTSDTDITDDLGTGDIRWRDAWIETISAGLTAADTLKLRGRDVDGSVYVNILTITSANTVTADLNAIVTIGSNAIAYAGGAFHDGFSDFDANEHYTQANITATGALNSGSIASGFGNIDVGSSSIVTTGTIAGITASNLVDKSATEVLTGQWNSRDHGTAATDEIINVCYGTGSPPTANTTTIGTLFVKYTA